VKAFLDAFRLEVRTVRADAGALLIFVVGVIAYSLAYPLPYIHQVMREVPVAVVDPDGSALSRRLTRMTDASELLRTFVVPDLATAEAAVRAGRAGGVLAIPRGFERDLLRGGQVTVEAWGDASYFLVYRQVLTGLTQSTGTLSAGIEIRRLCAAGMSLGQARAFRDPLPLVLRPLWNPAGGYASYVVPGVLMLVLQQTLLIGLGLLGGTARERGGDPRLEAARGRGRLTPVLLGRAGAYLMLAAGNAVWVFLVVFHIFRFPQRGGLGVLALFLLPFLLAVILLGLTLAHLFRNRETAIQVLLFTSLPAVFLAGFSWPVEAIPAPLRLLSQLLPTTPGIAGVLRITQMGAPLGAVLREWTGLWVLVALYFALAWAALRRAAGAAGA
jgi:ABC-2 type transport system permease protein